MPRSLHVEAIRLADIYVEEGGDPEIFSVAVEATFPNEGVEIFYSYHPNLEAFLPTLWFGESELVWDIADELVKRWAR